MAWIFALDWNDKTRILPQHSMDRDESFSCQNWRTNGASGANAWLRQFESEMLTSRAVPV
jgi:hypothetical protein